MNWLKIEADLLFGRSGSLYWRPITRLFYKFAGLIFDSRAEDRYAELFTNIDLQMRRVYVSEKDRNIVKRSSKR